MTTDSPVGATACVCGPEATCQYHQEPGAYFRLATDAASLRERLATAEEQAKMCHEFCRGADQRTAEARADAAALREQLAATGELRAIVARLSFDLATAEALALTNGEATSAVRACHDWEQRRAMRAEAEANEWRDRHTDVAHHGQEWRKAALAAEAERDELRGLLEQSCAAVTMDAALKGMAAARVWLRAHPAIPEGTPIDRK